MIAILVSYKSENGAARGFAEEMESSGLAAQVRAEDGCIRYDYFYPVGSDNTLFLWEQWESREHQKAHCQTEHFARLGQLKEQFHATTEIQIEDRA